MDYYTWMNMAKTNIMMPRITIQGGQTDGHLRPNASTSKGKNLQTKKNKLGVDYARKYQLEDEEEERKEAQLVMSGMSTVDDLTSMGTIPNINEPLSEHLTYIYDQYSFDNKRGSTLTINDYKQQIIESIDQNPVVIIKGQTGCGKTTQVPQFILDSCKENNIHCNIIVTQPRRIAAISVAKRVGEERNWPLGTIVGYQIALERQISQDTRLLYCTAGVLLQQLIKQQDLSSYTHIVIDEVHERDNETDFLLIILKRLIRHRGNRTKVILMSATINTDKFVDYFSKHVRNVKIEPPVIELEESTKYPVSCFYLDSLTKRINVSIPEVSLTKPIIAPDMYQLAVTLVEVFYKIDIHEHMMDHFLGSVLIFLPGLQQIETMFEHLNNRKNRDGKREEWMICPLHSTVTFDEQVKVFRLPPKGCRKIILATNIAESSITVPDVKYVIDFCLMKLQVQKPDTSYSTLQLSWVSKSQGSQRAGRVGRVMPGRVYRLVPESIYMEFEEECSPEILRCPLDTLVLKAKELNMGNPTSILGRAMDPPDLSNIQRTIVNLKEMGALCLTANGTYADDDGDLTFIGRVMATLPLDTQLSKLIILGHMFSCLSECVIMASAMAVKSIFSTPFKQQLDAYNSKLSWADSSFSDPISFLNVYWLWRHKTTQGAFKRSGGMSEMEWAQKYFVQIRSLKEVSRLETEILARLTRLGIHIPKGDGRINWSDIEKPLILKIVLAGAAYPNYFAKSSIDEKEAVKTIGGRDPFSTVYLSNFPPNQPGPLYIESIKNHFLHCGSNITVSFDGSFKVYLQFGSSQTLMEDDVMSIDLPGKIEMAVYRAIKLRHLQIPITIPLLPPMEAQKRAKEIFGDTINPNVFCWSKKQKKKGEQMALPGLSISILPVLIMHFESPGQFWVHLNDEIYSQRHMWINSHLSQPGFKVPIDTKDIVPGKLCIAPFTEVKSFYRAKILCVKKNKKPTVQVFFIDYGNKEIVSINELYDFTEEALAIGLVKEPPLAIECSLAEIQPSVTMNPKGVWSNDALILFKNFFANRRAIATIYSVVNSVMTVNLYPPDASTEVAEELNPTNSFNEFLIKSGFGERAEEPYLSRENHLLRKTAVKKPEMVSSSLFANEDIYSNVLFDPPTERECKTKVILKGPKSPLEMSLICLTRKCLGKEVLVEWSSVNSILLDMVPMDGHDRLLVALTVTQGCYSERLTLRNTTLMPNIHGLMALIAMIFSPKTELRADSDLREYTGAICGLGYDEETSESYNPENDMEITFDTKFDLIDLENINKLRFWMNYIIGGDEGILTDLSKVRNIEAQKKIKEYILELVGKRRDSKAPYQFDRSYEWGLVPEELLLDPQQGSVQSIYPLIWAIDLKEGTQASKLAAMAAHLKQLKQYAEGIELIRGGVKCELCQIYLEGMQTLKLHLHSSLHKSNFESFTSLHC